LRWSVSARKQACCREAALALSSHLRAGVLESCREAMHAWLARAEIVRNFLTEVHARHRRVRPDLLASWLSVCAQLKWRRERWVVLSARLLRRWQQETVLMQVSDWQPMVEEVEQFSLEAPAKASCSPSWDDGNYPSMAVEWLPSSLGMHADSSFGPFPPPPPQVQVFQGPAQEAVRPRSSNPGAQWGLKPPTPRSQQVGRVAFEAPSPEAPKVAGLPLQVPPLPGQQASSATSESKASQQPRYLSSFLSTPEWGGGGQSILAPVSSPRSGANMHGGKEVIQRPHSARAATGPLSSTLRLDQRFRTTAAESGWKPSPGAAKLLAAFPDLRFRSLQGARRHSSASDASSEAAASALLAAIHALTTATVASALEEWRESLGLTAALPRHRQGSELSNVNLH